MKVRQAIIGAAGNGERLGLGTKSLMIYKGRIILDYLVEECVKAGIDNIVISALSNEELSKVESQKAILFKSLIAKYPQIKLKQEGTTSYGRIPDRVRHLVNTSQPFYFFCGQSPHPASHLRKMSKHHSGGSLVVSGYKYRYDVIIPVAKVS